MNVFRNKYGEFNWLAKLIAFVAGFALGLGVLKLLGVLYV